MWKDWLWKAAFPAVFAALALRLCCWLLFPAPPHWDGTIYTALAQHLSAGYGYTHWHAPLRSTAFFPPGYPFALYASMQVFGASVPPAMVVNLFASACAVFASSYLSFRIGGIYPAKIAGFFCALLPGFALWSCATMTETLTGALLVGATAVGFRGTKNTGMAVFSGVLFGAAMLVRPQSVLSLLVLVWAIGTSLRERLRVLVLLLVGVFAVVAPWTARNCRVLDHCAVVSTNGGSNLLIGTFVEMHGGYRAPDARDGCEQVRGEVSRGACMTERAKENIRRAPGLWLFAGLQKVAKTMLWEWAPISYLRTALPGALARWMQVLLTIVCTVSWWIVWVGGLGGARKLLRSTTEGRALGRAVLGNSLLLLGTHFVFLGDDRYHLPLVPLLSAGVSAWWIAQPLHIPADAAK